jgi:hypothetical protein
MPERMLDNAPVWLVSLLFGVGLLVASEVGFRLGIWDRREGPRSDELVLAAAFTLMALLLGFTFSMGLERFDSRRATVVREANSIGTVAMRADLLGPKPAAEMRADLREYVAARLTALRTADDSDRGRATVRAEEIQTDLWRVALDASNRDPRSERIPLVLQSVGDLIDAEAEQRAALEAYVPKSVVVMLSAISIISMMLLGLRFGRNQQRETLAVFLLALMMALAIGIVLDLGAPQHGIITVSLAPLQDLKSSIQP